MVCSFRGKEKERSTGDRDLLIRNHIKQTQVRSLSVDLDCAGGIIPVDAVIVIHHLKTTQLMLR